jgi:DNA ligase-1
MKRFPILYKKTSTGKIQTWEVHVIENVMFSESGQLEGKKIQSSDTIREGKNIGRSNETTPEEQALAEAESRWTKKKKKGYVESLTDAGNDKVSDLVEGGFLPTLAHSFDKREKDIEYPCAVQPKLDGVRCTYNSGAKLWTRSRREIMGVPHVSKYILDKDINFLFSKIDGELYNHDFKDDFETIVHIAKQKTKPTEDHELVQYHVYDLPSDKPFFERMKDLKVLKKALGKKSPIIIVDTVICNNKEELIEYKEKCLEAGYEGAMVRNLKYGYEYKRSKHLQKLKIFEDAEFEIVRTNEGRGKLIGSAGSFTCKTKAGDEFDVKLKGKLEALRHYWNERDSYVGKTLTVQFQGYTNKNNVPRFPVGIRIREDM